MTLQFFLAPISHNDLLNIVSHMHLSSLGLDILTRLPPRSTIISIKKQNMNLSEHQV